MSICSCEWRSSRTFGPDDDLSVHLGGEDEVFCKVEEIEIPLNSLLDGRGRRELPARGTLSRETIGERSSHLRALIAD